MSPLSRPVTIAVSAGLGAGALILIRRMLIRRITTAARNKLDLQLPVPEDIKIAQAVQLTPIRELFGSLFGLGTQCYWGRSADQGRPTSLPHGRWTGIWR